MDSFQSLALVLHCLDTHFSMALELIIFPVFAIRKPRGRKKILFIPLHLDMLRGIAFRLHYLVSTVI